MGARHRPGRRRVRWFVPALVIVAVTTVGACGGVLWLAAHLLPRAVGGHDEAPMADVVELLKFGLAIGLSRWTQSL